MVEYESLEQAAPKKSRKPPPPVDFVTKRTIVRTKEEKASRIVSIVSTNPCKPRVKQTHMTARAINMKITCKKPEPTKVKMECTKVRASRIKCDAQSRRLSWHIKQADVPQLLVNFTNTNKIEKEEPSKGTILEGLHYVGHAITLTAMEQPIRLNSFRL